MSDSIIGRWTSTKNPRAFLDFAADGSLDGSDGANRIVTSWKADGDGAAIASFMTTQRAMQGMQAWVGRARRVTTDGDELNLLDRSDNHLGVLVRDLGSGGAYDSYEDR